jgi:hypothetical protein
MDGRPSADTPLPGGAANSPDYKRSSLASEGHGASRRSRSSELMRASQESQGAAANGAATQPSSTDESTSIYSAAGSGRSSFALERASLEANRASLEAFQDAFSTGPPTRLNLPPPPADGKAKPPAASAAVAGAPALGPALTLEQLCQAAQLPSSLREK